MNSGIIIPSDSFYFAEGVMPKGGIWSSSSNFSFIRSFLELCSLLEAVVLYDDLYTYMDEQASVYNCSSFGYQLYKEGLLKDTPTVLILHAIGVDQSASNKMIEALEESILLNHEKVANDAKGLSYFYYLHGDILIEASTLETGLGYKPLCMRDMLKPVSAETIKIQSELKRVYDSLTLKLKEKQLLRFNRGYPYKLFIPPIAAVVLEKAKDVEHIPEAMIEVREQFKKTREKFKQLEIVFSDDSHSLADVIEAERELKYISDALLNEDESAEESRVAFLRDFGSFLIKSLLKMGIDFESLYKLLSKDTTEWIDRKHKKRGALLLLDVSRKYKNIKNYGRLIEKVFSYSITENDLRVWQHYESLHQMDLRIDLKQFLEGKFFINAEPNNSFNRSGN